MIPETNTKAPFEPQPLISQATYRSCAGRLQLKPDAGLVSSISRPHSEACGSRISETWGFEPNPVRSGEYDSDVWYARSGTIWI